MQSYSGYVLESLMLSRTICTLNQTKQRLMVSVWSSRDQLESSHTSFVNSFFICIITSLIKLHAELWLIVNKTSLDCIVYKYSMSVSQDAIPGAKQLYLIPWIPHSIQKKVLAFFCYTDHQINTQRGGSGLIPLHLNVPLLWSVVALLSPSLQIHKIIHENESTTFMFTWSSASCMATGIVFTFMHIKTTQQIPFQ